MRSFNGSGCHTATHSWPEGDDNLPPHDSGGYSFNGTATAPGAGCYGVIAMHPSCRSVLTLKPCRLAMLRRFLGEYANRQKPSLNLFKATSGTQTLFRRIGIAITCHLLSKIWRKSISLRELYTSVDITTVQRLVARFGQASRDPVTSRA